MNTEHNDIEENEAEDNGIVICADCGKVIRQDESHENADGDPVCESCLDNYYTCEDCDSVVHSSDINTVGDGRDSRNPEW
jgi:UDP-N-acetylmuramyl tripeptide synthase